LELLKSGHQVTVIGRSLDNLKELTAAGAKAAIGSVADFDFLVKTFTGADAIYTMVPPTWDAADWKGHIGQQGENYASAIEASGVKKVVNLSSIGAHMETGCGPVSGLFRVEKAYSRLTGVAILHLRPGFFYNNFLANIGMIKHMNIMGGNYGTNSKMVLVHPTDIAVTAAKALIALDFTGHSIQYVVSDEKTPSEIAAILGAAIGKPELPWVDFTDEQNHGGMIQAGLSEEVAKNYTEMGGAVKSGEMAADYANKPKPVFGNIPLEDFAKTFAIIYNS
ncbi:MAG: NAD-dependent dehydratase, partial [Sphingobacteriia bacterium 39-39-8]